MRIQECPLSHNCGGDVYFCRYARFTDCPYGGCAESLKEKPVKPAPRIGRNPEAGHAELTAKFQDELENNICKLYREGMSIERISDKLCVVSDVVSGVLNDAGLVKDRKRVK